MLNDLVVVVTGGAGLLGRDFCHRIAKSRGIVVVADIDIEAAERVVEDVILDGGSGIACFLDITSLSSITALIETVHNKYGHIDGLVNNAYPRNSSYGKALEEVSYEDFCANMSMHLGGYFLMSQQFAQYFRTRGGGNIVNIGSIYGTKAPRFEIYEGTAMTMPVEYAAIKSSVIQLTSYFAQYFKKEGVRCNSLSPGGVLDAQPEQFVEAYNSHCGTIGMLSSADIAGALVFLLSRTSAGITGQNLVLDDGFTL